MDMFFTYALYSETFDVIYCGQTENLQKRINEHNGLGASKTWACRYRPFMVGSGGGEDR